MSVPLTCYDYIIGLSRTACSDCYTIPADAGTSYSGLFLDELEPLRNIASLINCESGTDLFEIMDRARDEAILKFIADADALLQQDYQLRRRPFYGSIGKVRNTATRALTAGWYAGARWNCADIVSGVAQVNNIGTIFSQTGNITLFVYNNLNELVTTVVLNTTANTHTLNTVSFELPLHSNYVDNLEYFFVYVVGANLPLNNDLSGCACGTSPTWCFDTECPYYGKSQTNRQWGWANYAMVGGYTNADLDDIDNCTSTTNNFLNGLTFQVDFKCKVNEVLCLDALDFEANPLALSMAHAVYYKAAELLMNKIQLSPNLSWQNMINNDAMNAARPVYIDNYDKIIKYIVETVDITGNDCLDCRDWHSVTKGGILS